MNMNETPSSERVHIGFFGSRNAGKSSLVNAVTGQELAVVSDVKGTTTDPVRKAMELLPMGPVLIIDTPGIDDTGALGELRVRKTKQVLNQTDVAVLVVDGEQAARQGGLSTSDTELIAFFRAKNVPYIVAYNKCDLCNVSNSNISNNEIYVSAVHTTNIEELKNRIAAMAKTDEKKLRIVGDIISPGDFVVLVTPIDKAAPKGRLILPQQQTIRDILEADAAAIVVKEFELRDTLASLGKKPALVITDSQVFAKVSADTPPDVHLTSFSILFARYKGFLLPAVRGAAAISTLQDGDTVLICEGCTHHRQCDDIGTVKLPRWIRNFCGKELRFDFSSGTGFPDDFSPYKLVVHCGACMLNDREVRYRQKCAEDQNAPFTNYGVLIAYMQGILKRSVSMFPAVAAELE